MISKETKDKILAAADIVEVISEFVKLKKRGANYVGLCPFHNEKTPSFTVSPVKGIFKCFGCGKAGDVVTFLMEHEKISYVEALKYLARKYGIEIEETEPDPEAETKKKLRESILILNQFATEFFKKNLLNSDYGKSVALPYLIERGIPDFLIEKFELGYALPGGKDFINYARLKGYKEDLLLQAGLITKKGNSYSDKFIGRIMFPIHNLTGKIIGFGGRIIGKAENTAKYLNTQETEVFQKRYNLYGLYFAKKHIVSQDKCYLVEGYTDVIGFHKAGIENVVASLGTSLTTEQIITIRRFTKNLTIVYDGDPAGIKASLRGIDLALEEGMNVKVVELPEGEDPDSITNSWSGTEVIKYLNENETDFIRYKANILLKDTKDDPFKKSSAISDILTSVAAISNRISREIYIKEISKIFDTSEQSLLAELNKILANKKKLLRYKDKNKETNSNENKTQHISTEFESIISQEKEIIKLLLKFGERTITIKDEEFSVANYIISEVESNNITFINKTFDLIYNEYKKGNSNINYYISHENEEVRKFAADIQMTKYDLSKIFVEHNVYINTEEEMLAKHTISSIALLKIKLLEQKREKEQKILKEAEEKGDTNQILKSINLITQINQVITELKKEVI
jgi:DNA primase